MSKTTVNWSSPEAWQRVIASLLATGIKPDLKAAALYFGTTYDTLENRFRKLKKDAQALKAEVESGDRKEISTPSRSKHVAGSGRATPKKGSAGSVLDLGVLNGRITKATPASKKKKAARAEEVIDTDEFESPEGGINGSDESWSKDVEADFEADFEDDDMFTLQ